MPFKDFREFIDKLDNNKGESIAIVTHNVVLRCLIGEAHAIPQQDWYRLAIPHAEPLEFKLLDGRLYANIPRAQLVEIFAGLRTM